jgi:NADH-quinone oxidoreductase subunit E
MAAGVDDNMGVLSEDLKNKIRAYFPRYPTRQAVTLPALHLVQEALQCVPKAAMRELADLLDLAPADVLDTMSFYGFFRPEENPAGKTRVWVCQSLACALQGGESILWHLCNSLEIEPGHTTADGRISVETAECLGACEGAPCILVRDDCLMAVGDEEVEAVLRDLRAEAAAGTG